MATFSCFVCPARDHSPKALGDSCPTCGRKYHFPLTDAPKQINDYKILKALGRGFYGVTYTAEKGALRTKSALKVSPKILFDFFDKNFEEECHKHRAVAEGTQHIVEIRDMFSDVILTFGDVEVLCHVAELRHIDGKPLADYLEPNSELTATTGAQIAIDLLRIHDELQRKEVNHNDLHAENIIVEALNWDSRRAEAIDGSIRAVAIDLGSVSDGSRSDSRITRLGDLHWIASHLNGIIDKLLRDPDEISDLDNRVASALQLIVHNISPSVENQRTPISTDFINQIQDAYYRATDTWRPWSEPLQLRTFNASYNAQTMHAWHVPQLLVDPDGQWINSICAPGPQVITGMRGCGKTMLLRALQFHARAARLKGNPNRILENLKSEKYVGLYVSAQRLLDRFGENADAAPDPFARLFVAYALEAVKALRHLSDIDETSVTRMAQQDLTQAIAGCLNKSGDITSATTLHDLHRRLSFLLTSLSRRDFKCLLEQHPGTAFPFLAEAIRRCSPMWQEAQILYLLDDVSTRYLTESRIEELLSALLFQDNSCAFKVTSEAQTIELGLKSPGRVHPARVGRDISIFDLGAKVYETIKSPGQDNGRNFVEKILLQRAQHFPDHTVATRPGQILGDVPLETIATEIGESSRNSGQRKRIYRGITALARVCVGDIGDVISLYEQILKRGGTRGPFPIAPDIQSECFQEFCARRLYDLNRRGGFLKNVAKSFAEASYDLLVESCKKPLAKNGKKRIRQYSSLYVRVTTGDLEKQTERLRELIDAGVFVFAGGSSVPRTKTRDSNPIQQFKLAYRKIYGLVDFIGLADRDRFELSGNDLEEWLSEPSGGKKILLRNFAENESDSQSDVDPNTPATKVQQAHQDTKSHAGSKHDRRNVQLALTREQKPPFPRQEDVMFLQRKKPVVLNLGETFPDISIEWALLGLGFEERTLESSRRLCSTAKPQNVVAVEYEEPGRSGDIKSALTASAVPYSTIKYNDIIRYGLPDFEHGNELIDITGLAKPVIFHAIRNGLRRKRRVWICHTEAQSYYPLETDLKKVFDADEFDYHAQLEHLSQVLTGEVGPYAPAKLLQSDSDDSRQRILCAFSSPKHERLLSLLDGRDYDRIEIIAPEIDSSRNKVAKIAAENAARNYTNSNVTKIDSNDIDGALMFITNLYKWWYIDHGSNFEFGLTGSKLQAVACAAASAAYKVSQCWYVRPEQFDPDRFTKGIGNTQFYEISLNDEEHQNLAPGQSSASNA